MYCVWNCSQGRELTYFANTSTLSNYGKRLGQICGQQQHYRKILSFKKMEERNKKRKFSFSTKLSPAPFFICSHFHSRSIFFSSHSKNSFMYKNRGMISVCNKQCGDDDWPDKKSRHGYIWPWIDILENYFPSNF